MLVLSLFNGVCLLDQAFREKGFCVVSAHSKEKKGEKNVHAKSWRQNKIKLWR